LFLHFLDAVYILVPVVYKTTLIDPESKELGSCSHGLTIMRLSSPNHTILQHSMIYFRVILWSSSQKKQCKSLSMVSVRQSSPQNMSKERLSGPKVISVQGIHSTQSCYLTPLTLYFLCKYDRVLQAGFLGWWLEMCEDGLHRGASFLVFSCTGLVARVLTLYSDFGLGPSMKPLFIPPPPAPQETWDPILPRLEVQKKTKNKKEEYSTFCIECEDWFNRLGLDKKNLTEWFF